MIVKYARERGYEGEGKDPHLTLGELYFVLDITFKSEDKKNEIIVQTESDGLPAVFYLKFFDIIDPRIPESWVLFTLSRGSYRLTPEEFTGDFWEWYYDGTPEQTEQAEKVFLDVITKIQRFHDSSDS